MYTCKICGMNYVRPSLFAKHLSVKHDLTFVEYHVKHEGFVIPSCVICGNPATHKSGLTFRKTCSRECISKNSSLRKHDLETKERIRSKRIKWMKANPDKTAWRLGKEPSWPEKFFIAACNRAGLENKHNIVRELSVFPYFIDFAFVDLKIAVEVDGSQHKNMVAHDAKKDNHLRNLGWVVYRIPSNKLYPSETDADNCIAEMIQNLKL